MRKIYDLVRDYARTAANPWSFGLVAALLGLSIWANYTFHVERNIIDVPVGMPQAAAKFALFYSFPFLAAFAIQTAFAKDREFLKNRRFYFLLVMAPLVFALRDVSWLYVLGARNPSPFWNNVGDTVIRWILCLAPIILYWRATREPGEPLYGLTVRNIHLKPYFGMLAVMVPLVAIASFQGDFLHAYPRAELVSNKGIPHFSNLQYTVYEIVYGLDFVFTEFFFRGFVILAFAKVCGHAAILPMAAFYVFIHFGKPMGEAMSSFFGGLILGVVALETRSIFGGVIVHLGIAWLMELTAFAQKFFR